MSKVKIRVEFPRFNTGLKVSNKNFRTTALRAEQFARNSILQNARTGNKWPDLPYTSAGKKSPPASQFGALARSITSGFTNGLLKKTVWVGINGRMKGTRYRKDGTQRDKVAVARYWAAQEFGSPAAGLPERPYLRPALQKAFATYKISPQEYIDTKKIKRTFNFK